MQSNIPPLLRRGHNDYKFHLSMLYSLELWLLILSFRVFVTSPRNAVISGKQVGIGTDSRNTINFIADICLRWHVRETFVVVSHVIGDIAAGSGKSPLDVVGKYPLSILGREHRHLGVRPSPLLIRPC